MNNLNKCQPVPLTRSLGQPAQGKDRFFPRPFIMRKICHEIDNGENLLISAPRRIGKSSLLKAIQEQKCTQANTIYLYMIIQSVDSSELFFNKLFKALISDENICTGLTGYIKRASHSLKDFISRLRGISLEGGIQMDAKNSIDYYHECYELLTYLENKRVVVIVDEFPDALARIDLQDRNQAIYFLQQHRDLRQQFNSKLQFVYTGSTGLRNVVKKIGTNNLINDLAQIEIPPFSTDESCCLIKSLVLGYQRTNPNFDLTETQIDYILRKITWYLPFYLQTIIHALYNRFDDTQQNILPKDIDNILMAMTKAKSPYAAYFENWQSRLEKTFNKEEYQLAITLLTHIAQHQTTDKATLDQLGSDQPLSKEERRFVLQTLEYDGYISQSDSHSAQAQQQYQFNSELLKQWWIENVID